MGVGGGGGGGGVEESVNGKYMQIYAIANITNILYYLLINFN